MPEAIVTDGLGSYKTGLDRLGLRERHRPGRLRENNRAENPHLPIQSVSANDRHQEHRLSRAVPHGPRCRLQHLLQPAASHQPNDAAHLPKPGTRRLERGRRMIAESDPKKPVRLSRQHL